ncbi:MAG: putative transport system permease protein [Patescibacteria group bacterium]|nr:putative transport system permease protein [Patescibacteria group bacterium]
MAFFGKDIRVEGEVKTSPDSGFSFGEDTGTIIIPYAAAIAIPEIKSLSRSDFSIIAKSRTDEEADALAQDLKADIAGSGIRVRSFRGGAGGAVRIVDDVSAYVSEALSVVFFLAATAAFFFSRAVWIANRRYFSVLRILGASRVSVSMAFSAFFLTAAFCAAIVAIALSFSVFELVPFPKDFGTPRIGWTGISRLLLTLPFVLVPAIVPGIVSIFSTAPLSGLGEPRLALPKRADAAYAASFVFLGTAVFLVLVSGISVWEAIRKSATVVVSISAVLLLAYFAIRLVARAFFSVSSDNFALFDSTRLALSPGSPAFPVVSAFVVPAMLFASFSSLAFHFSSELERLSTSGVDVFAINLLPKGMESVRAAFPHSEAFSIVRARISKINGRTLSEHLEGEPSREFSREFNITSSSLDEDVIAGADRPIRTGEVSLDAEFAQNLGIGVGDRISFAVMGREFELQAVNVRESLREGIRPFFYFQTAPGEFANVPVSYFVSASTPDVETFKTEVVKVSGPYVSFVDVRQAVAIVRSSAERILPAVWAFLVAIAALSVTVATAALSSLRNFRASRERAYKAIGASREFLRRQAVHTLVFYAVSAFAAAGILAFPAVWGGIASVSFLKFSLPAALKAMGVLFGFLLFASGAVAAYERKS